MEKLRAADIGMKIVTGDNPLTALAVARQCSLVPENSEVYLIDFDASKKILTVQ